MASDVVAVMGDLAAERGLFRARDLEAAGFSRAWLDELGDLAGARQVDRGVWSHVRYTPTRYELAQIRLPGAVFWGPSARWLQGWLDEEPACMWLALDDHASAPRRLEERTLLVRCRSLDEAVVATRPLRTAFELRVHQARRARRDVSRRLRRKHLREVERLELARALDGVRADPLAPAELARRERPRVLRPSARTRLLTSAEWRELLRLPDGAQASREAAGGQVRAP